MSDKTNPSHVRFLAQIGEFPLKIDMVALAPDGTSLIIAIPGSGISIWDLEAARQQSLFEIPEGAFRSPDPIVLQDMAPWVPVMVRSLAMSDDGAFVAAAFTNQDIGLWLSDGTLLETISCPAVDLFFFPQTHLLALCRDNGIVEVWETTPARLLTTFVGVADLVEPSLAWKNVSRCRMACSPDGAQIAVFATWYMGHVVSRVFIWDLMPDSRPLQPLLQRTLPGPSASLAKGWYRQADPRVFCVSYEETTVWAIHPATEQIEALVPNDILWPRPQRLSVSPNGRYVALADAFGT